MNSVFVFSVCVCSSVTCYHLYRLILTMVTIKIWKSSQTQRNSRRWVFLTTYIAALNKIRDPARKEEGKWIWGTQQAIPATKGSYFRQREFSMILEV